MTRAKAWLFAQGHIKSDGRGRMPLKSEKTGEGIVEILSKAKDSGVTFSDWPKGELVTSEKTDEVIVKRSSAMSHHKVVAEIAPYTYPENSFQAYIVKGGKRQGITLRECCNNCRVSLVQCHCANPTVWGEHKVYIEPVKRSA